MRMIAQLFTRGSEALGENEYMVCGVVKTSEPLDKERVNVILAELGTVVGSEAFPEHTVGNGFDGIMRSPVWRRFARKP